MTLSLRALNRATLARQLLLQRPGMGALEGDQGQAPFAPYCGLWSRLDGKNGVFPGTLLIDGSVAGTWELEGKGEDGHAGAAIHRA